MKSTLKQDPLLGTKVLKPAKLFQALVLQSLSIGMAMEDTTYDD